MRKLSGLLFIGLFLSLAACSSAGEAPTATPSPQPAATALPTPASPGDTITWQALRLTLDQLEISEEYVTEYGSTRTPPAGQKFLWVHLRLKNTGPKELGLPGSEHFSVLYAGTELKPTYGHRKDHTDYTTLGPVIFPDEGVEAWLRFDIPATAEMVDLRFVFLPTSAQVGVSPSSPSYPYAKNKLTYVWKLER